MDKKNEWLQIENIPFLEELFSKYQEDPNSVDASFHPLFDICMKGTPLDEGAQGVNVALYRMIDTYRRYGHLAADIFPFPTKRVVDTSFLSPSRFGIEENDLEKLVPGGRFSTAPLPLKELTHKLKQAYTSSIGFEYMGCGSQIERWMKEEIERGKKHLLRESEKGDMLDLLMEIRALDDFIRKHFIGKRHFSIQGADMLIPMLKHLFSLEAEGGLNEVVIGAPSRGRVDILAHLFKKPLSKIFYEIEEGCETREGRYGDLLYHSWQTGDINLKNGKLYATVLPGVSSPELLSPILLGYSKGRQRALLRKGKKSAFLPILIHNDGSISSQGAIYETMQLAKLKGHSVGGVIHIVLSNDIAKDSHKSGFREYKAAIAKSFSSPVLHVNGEDMEACFRAVKIASEYRKVFQQDIFINFNCYRRYGHHESDDPTFKEPLLYEKIQKSPSIYALYKEKCAPLHAGECEEKETHYYATLQRGYADAKRFRLESLKFQENLKSPQMQKSMIPLEENEIEPLLEKALHVKEGFSLHPKLLAFFEKQKKRLKGEQKVLDWTMAEKLLYACLLKEGIDVRLMGRDAPFGPFGTRHVTLIDQRNEEEYTPLCHLSDTQGTFEACSFPSSYLGGLGFSWGYALSDPKSLVIFELSFGDLLNHAQSVIDHFIAVSKERWNTSSSLVLFCPYGYEGMGPDQSASHIERFLSLAAKNCMRLVCPTTPKQLFSCLKEGVESEEQRPLILFTPKKLLRFSPSFSELKEMLNPFSPLLDDPNPPKKVKRVILTYGKIYYDLLEKRDTSDTALIRIEELYPFPFDDLKALFQKYKGFKECLFVQEEPRNMGAWNHFRPKIEKLLGDKISLRYVGRKENPSPAPASYTLYKKEEELILKESFVEMAKEEEE